MRLSRIPCGLVLAVLVLLTGCDAPRVRQAPLPSDTAIVLTFSGTDESGGLQALHANTGLPLWKKPLGKFNWPPVMANGVVYGIVDEHSPMRRSVVAVRASDGEQLWRVPTDVSSTLAADDSIVAVAMRSGGLYGLDPATGAQRWHIAGTGSYELALRHGIVYTTMVPAPPLGGLSFPTGTAVLVAVRAGDGGFLWQMTFDDADMPVVANDHAIYGTAPTGTVAAFDAHTGRPLAAFPYNGASYFAAPGAVEGYAMAASEDFVLLGGYTPRAQHLRALSAVDGHLLWDAPVEFGVSAEFTTTVAISGDFVIGADGSQIITAVRVRDGSVAWQAPRFGDHSPFTLSVTHGVIFAMLPAAAPEEGPCLSDCTPAIVALDAANGAIYWQRDEPGAQMIVATDQP